MQWKNSTTRFGVIAIVLHWCVALNVFTPQPQPLSNHQPWEIRTAHRVHLLTYLLLLMIMLSGYLISTVDNRSIEVLGWFSIPSIITSIPNQADNAGDLDNYTYRHLSITNKSKY